MLTQPVDSLMLRMLLPPAPMTIPTCEHSVDVSPPAPSLLAGLAAGQGRQQQQDGMFL